MFSPYLRKWDIHQRILLCLEGKHRKNAKFILPTYWILSFLKPNKESKSNGDDLRDQIYIMYGIMLYNEDH